MSKSLETTTTRLYADAASGNHKSFLDALADDIVMIHHSRAPHAGKFTGKAALIEVMGRAKQSTVDESRTIEKVLSNDDTVVVIGREEFTVVATGKRAKGPFIHHLTFREGKVASFEDFEVAGAAAWA